MPAESIAQGGRLGRQGTAERIGETRGLRQALSWERAYSAGDISRGAGRPAGLAPGEASVWGSFCADHVGRPTRAAFPGR